jgi:hypothetical protein
LSYLPVPTLPRQWAGNWVIAKPPLTIRAGSWRNCNFRWAKATSDSSVALRSTPNTAPQLVFENITFANGYSTQNGVAAGVTLDGANAVFVNATSFKIDPMLTP